MTVSKIGRPQRHVEEAFRRSCPFPEQGHQASSENHTADGVCELAVGSVEHVGVEEELVGHELYPHVNIREGT